MLEDNFLYFAIFGMAVTTYATRLAGYWLLRGRSISGRVKAALEAVPPAILTAVIAPTVFLQGPVGIIAGVVTIVTALLRAPLLVTIAVGVGTVALLRAFL
jgi:uncharacterized membrane protein